MIVRILLGFFWIYLKEFFYYQISSAFSKKTLYNSILPNLERIYFQYNKHTTNLVISKWIILLDFDFF